MRHSTDPVVQSVESLDPLVEMHIERMVPICPCPSVSLNAKGLEEKAILGNDDSECTDSSKKEKQKVFLSSKTVEELE